MREEGAPVQAYAVHPGAPGRLASWQPLATGGLPLQGLQGLLALLCRRAASRPHIPRLQRAPTPPPPTCPAGFIDTPLSRNMSGGGLLRFVWRVVSAVPGMAGLMGSKTVPQVGRAQGHKEGGREGDGEGDGEAEGPQVRAAQLAPPSAQAP